MKLNTDLHNGIKVLVYISLNDRGNGIFQKEIAEKYGMSIKFLDHVIAALKTASLIHRKKGYRSGYTLSARPSDITLYAVYRAFEPELEIYPCLNCNSDCPQSDSCATHVFMESVNKEIKQIIEEKTIEDICTLQIKLLTTNIKISDKHTAPDL